MKSLADKHAEIKEEVKEKKKKVVKKDDKVKKDK